MTFRDLRADEIDCRVQQIGKDNSYVSILLYKDARCDMNILDETVGTMNWQRDHKELKGNIYCGVSLWDEQKQQWITKWDCGKESNTEAEKGEASDSFKRACFNLGIGRELYTSPPIFIREGFVIKEGKCKTSFYIKSISIVDKKIVALEIINNLKQLVFTWALDKPQSQNSTIQGVGKVNTPPKQQTTKNEIVESHNEIESEIQGTKNKIAMMSDEDIAINLERCLKFKVDGRPLSEWYKNTPNGREYLMGLIETPLANEDEIYNILIVEESVKRHNKK